MFALLTTPVYDAWFAALRDVHARQRIALRLRSVQMGNLGDCKSVGGGVKRVSRELRPGYRVYFHRRGLEVIVLLCGGTKSAQQADIKRAQALAAALEE